MLLTGPAHAWVCAHEQASEGDVLFGQVWVVRSRQLHDQAAREEMQITSPAASRRHHR